MIHEKTVNSRFLMATTPRTQERKKGSLLVDYVFMWLPDFNYNDFFIVLNWSLFLEIFV